MSPSILARAWHRFPLKTEHLWLNCLLIMVPAALVLRLMHALPLVIFTAAALAIIPMAGVLGESTSTLAAYAGPTAGGLLNATLGNATEFIIALVALQGGHIKVVQASLSGSIIGNLLLVLGLSIVAGGLKRDVLRFPRSTASMHSTMLMIAAAGLIMPAVFDMTAYGSLGHTTAALESLSLWTSGTLIIVYVANLFYVFRTRRSAPVTENERVKPEASRTQALLALLIATVVIAVLSELLVAQIESVTRALGMTELFVGVIVVAVIGNAAEHSTAILMARRNQMELSLTIAAGSSTQIALLVAPALVFISAAMGHPMTLVFHGFEIAAIVLSIVIVEMISSDGETNWFEGAQLLALYVILSAAFYFLPE
ncbi:MAG: calcium/proton exchanger [Acidobacteriia bacterium]|nr:calcium/proton exchanger [Terriglobia bacterium]